MIIYPYRDAIEALQLILDENKWGSELERRELAELCDEYLGYFDRREDEDGEDDELL